ncbi:MAG: hypothetical protein PHW47_01465 [Lachnospira sp.]|nr:hypothetical protein [Lachnospira sp.]
MITLIILVLLAILALIFWIGFHIFGAALLVFGWMFIKIPIAFVVFILGLVCCCTLILIPIGFMLFKLGVHLLIPGM